MIVQVKDNQPTLHQLAQEISATITPFSSAQSHNKGRNRDERRIVTVFDPANKLAGTDWHSQIAAIIRVKRDVYTRNSKTGLLSHSSETAFYIANAPVTATRAAEAIRGHWAHRDHLPLHPGCHHGRGPLRIRCNPGVFARMRSFAFNILKANQTNTLSQDRYRAALAGIDNLLKLIGVS